MVVAQGEARFPRNLRTCVYSRYAASETKARQPFCQVSSLLDNDVDAVR